MNPVDVTQGSSPIILGFPHTGTDVPDDILARLNENGRLLADTDWHIDRLYDGLLPEVTTVRATFHRYVIDANRDPAGVSLYPGQNTTGLVPETDFDGKPIWRDGEKPTAADIETRLKRFHSPYHVALAREIERVRAEHGLAILYDCHSIRSHIPFLFEGKLPDFNIGTNEGNSCSPEIASAVGRIVFAARGYDAVINGRFKGGWTTRHYGQPQLGVHAIQMELTQSSHLKTEAPPFAYDEVKAEKLRKHLKDVLEIIKLTAVKLGSKQ
ncbi:N-formylglutamate deformylase [Phyllobacterium endophyticum]|uniref:N-formylglutamate deformylase n=1 Tax=Phyllobacterium endophyticum TaxID=1149773 RepID=A0A2P7B005_9HYPH|nr:N-formylglutamate deformylase [Phyllobacterium endophyticum]MBB3235558.1 formiminoglutamase [Phyllobacterium endophyticum]PSH59806.1 N-formylglutamate deformylase [Phyllobacterium endophyticum]TXR47979.1 N-formylglutamate deformylase [Phyllobacterium endophyticum]TYR41955.1 N-formylglutamate deformylase [Phyllobacterium endophyticum]